jgi:hypothetical protein
MEREGIMATIEVKVTWCDQHLLEGQEVAGTPRAVALDGLMGTVDLCDPCMKELTAKLLFLLETKDGWANPDQASVADPEYLAQLDPPEKPQKRARFGPKYSGKRQWVCLFGDEEYATTAGLRSHLETVHGITDSSVGSVYGHICPLDGEDMGHGKQSATSHARNVHRKNNVSRLFKQAAERGDRHGVVASRVEALRG